MTRAESQVQTQADFNEQAKDQLEDFEEHQQAQKRTKNKAGQFGRPLIPFFLNEDANGETPTGGYSVNEDLFLTDEQAQQQERVFVPKGEKSIRVREFKDGYFEYKDLSFDSIQEKLTFHSPIKQQQQQQQQANNSNQPQFFSQHENINNANNNNGNNGNKSKMTKTSSRDHFANYERMVIPFQHKNNMTKSNDNSSSSDENKRQSDEDKQEEEEKKAKKKKPKKKVMIPVNVQKQNVTTRNTNQENQQNYSTIQQSPTIPASTVNHTVMYPRPLLIHSPIAYSPSSPTVYPKQATNHQLLTPSLFGINRSSSMNSSNNSSYSPNSVSSSSGLLKPSTLLNQSLNSMSVKSPVSTIPSQKVPTHHFQQRSMDVSYLENNILPQYYQEQPSYNYSMNGSAPNTTQNSEPAVEPVSQMVSSSSSTSLTEKELLSILMNDGSVNFTPDEPENPEQKHKKFAGGSWSNSPHPSEIPKPNFK